MAKDMSHLPEDYDPKAVQLVLLVVFLANLFVNIDMGILPAGSTPIKKDLKLNHS